MKSKNEATFEARVNAEIKRIFPSLANLTIKHQLNFTVRLGHGTVNIDGKKMEKLYGRLDILLSIDDKPLAILELKRPNNQITQNDIEQGFSYVPFLNPQPPLVVISNGTDTRIYKSYNKEMLKPTTIDEKAIQVMFKNALARAASDLDDAINLLLGHRPDVWVQVVKDYTKKSMEQLEGKINNFKKPIVKNFIIKRTVVSKISNLLSKGKKFIALVGDHLSGKTNVLYQLCISDEHKKFAPMYVNASTTAHGIFRQISNQFSSTLHINSTPNDIRHWMMHGLNNPNNGRLVIVVDGWSVRGREKIKKDIDELINIASENNAVSVVLSMDRFTYNEFSNNSLVYFKCVELLRLNDEEFDYAQKKLFKNYKIAFHNGVKYNAEYRNPRVLRLLASRNSQINDDEIINGHLKAYVYSSVTDMSILDYSWGLLSLPQDRINYKSLVKSFIQDASNRIFDDSLSVMSYGIGCTIFETMQGIAGQNSIDSLIEAGHVELINGPNDKVLLIPKIPEFFAAVGVYYFADEFLRICHQSSFEEAYNFLVKQSEYFPYGDIAAAKAIVEISKRDGQLLTQIIHMLLEDEPCEEKATGKTLGLLNNPEDGIYKIRLLKNNEGILISNLHPWLILSQTSILQLASDDGSRDIQLHIFDVLGSYKGLLRRVDIIPYEKMKGFHFHDVKGQGSILCKNIGIIEPIVWAMQSGFYQMPDEMIRLCEWAADQGKFILSWRLYIAAESVLSCADKNVADGAKKSLAILDKLIKMTLGRCFNVK